MDDYNVDTSQIHGLSTPKQNQRADKMFNGDGLKLLYMWVKQNQVSFKEFVELASYYMKE